MLSESKMATGTVPKFSLFCLNHGKRQEMRSTLVQETASMENTHSEEVVREHRPSLMSQDTFFCVRRCNNKGLGIAEDEVRKYFEDKDKSFDSLKSFPIVQYLFLKYKTTLPSSAPVEHLFSYGGNLFTPQQNRMSDAHLEDFLLL